jgi:hypothetical protein
VTAYFTPHHDHEIRICLAAHSGLSMRELWGWHSIWTPHKSGVGLTVYLGLPIRIMSLLMYSGVPMGIILSCRFSTRGEGWGGHIPACARLSLIEVSRPTSLTSPLRKMSNVWSVCVCTGLFQKYNLYKILIAREGRAQLSLIASLEAVYSVLVWRNSAGSTRCKLSSARRKCSGAQLNSIEQERTDVKIISGY